MTIRWLRVVLVVAALATGCAPNAPGSAGGNVEPQERISREIDPWAQEELVVDGKVVGQRVKPRSGEICLVCNLPISNHDAVYLVNGQRAAIHLGECEQAVRSRASEILAKLKPRGAFLGAGRNAASLSGSWFFAGLYVLIGLAFAALCAHRALHSGRSPVAWFTLGLVLNAFGYLWLWTRPRLEIRSPSGVPRGLGKFSSTYAPQACPGCGESNHPSAGRCSGCGAKLQPIIDSEVHKAGLHRI